MLMNSKSILTIVTAMVMIVLLNASASHAQVNPFDRDSLKLKDSVSLRSGSKLYGEILKQDKNENGREFTIIKTEAGSTLKLDSRFVEKTHVLDEIDRLYNNKIEIIEDTPEGHWSAVSWCVKQSSGKNRFKDQLDFHYHRIMELDPNDTKVKQRLGYKYIESQNRWVPESLYYQSLGYVRKGTGWAPSLQLTINENGEANNDYLGERKKRYATWKRFRKKFESGANNVSEAELANDLYAFCDGAAVPFIFNDAKRDRSGRFRSLFIEAFGKVPTNAATQALVYFSVEDPVQQNRERALDLLQQPHYNQAYAASHLSRYFDTKKYPNRALQIAAFNIGELEAEGAILPLIGVLSTKHVISPGDDPGRINQSVDPLTGDINTFGVGNNSAPTSVVIDNENVTAALRKITGQDYGFNQLAWKRWYIENHTLLNVSVRGD